MRRRAHHVPRSLSRGHRELICAFARSAGPFPATAITTTTTATTTAAAAATAATAAAAHMAPAVHGGRTGRGAGVAHVAQHGLSTAS